MVFWLAARTLPLRSTLQHRVQFRGIYSQIDTKGLREFFDNENGWVWGPRDPGREWRPDELRKKDFKDLHALWWICIKENNKLTSQQQEAKLFKLGFPHEESLSVVRKTMNNIKLVLWERRVEWCRAREALNVLSKYDNQSEITEEDKMRILEAGLSYVEKRRHRQAFKIKDEEIKKSLTETSKMEEFIV